MEKTIVMLPKDDMYIRSTELCKFIDQAGYRRFTYRLQAAYDRGKIKGVNIRGRNYYSLASVAIYLGIKYEYLIDIISKIINEKASRFNCYDYKKFYILSEQDVLKETEEYKDRLNNVRKLSLFIATEFADALPEEAKAELLAIVNNEKLSTADRNRLDSILEDYIYPMNSAK